MTALLAIFQKLMLIPEAATPFRKQPFNWWKLSKNTFQKHVWKSDRLSNVLKLSIVQKSNEALMMTEN